MVRTDNPIAGSPVAHSQEPSGAAPSSAAVRDQLPGTEAVPTRPLEFEEWIAGMPKYFAADGDIVMSHILAVLSSVFPDGEDFFVRSVRAAADEIHDPDLAADVEGFVGQESMHGREHRVLNDKLAELGYPTHAIGRYVRALTGFRERIQGKKFNLAFTAALEHYTATLAETLLGDEAARDQIGHPGARYLLMWHALEEAEHKAVAFDVYRGVGGSERMRVVAMWLTHMTFVLETGIWAAISIAGDADARRHPIKLAKSVWKLRKSPFTTPRAVKQLFEYHRRGFHPNDRDTVELVATWRRNLFGPQGELTELVAS
jgi:predicted metal-dependent hydrolase